MCKYLGTNRDMSISRFLSTTPFRRCDTSEPELVDSSKSFPCPLPAHPQTVSAGSVQGGWPLIQLTVSSSPPVKPNNGLLMRFFLPLLANLHRGCVFFLFYLIIGVFPGVASGTRCAGAPRRLADYVLKIRTPTHAYHSQMAEGNYLGRFGAKLCCCLVSGRRAVEAVK